MTEFEKAHESYLKAASEHVHLDQLLAKLSVMVGLVYDPTKDSEMDAQLSELSRQIYVLRVFDELQSFLIHGNRPGNHQPPDSFREIYEQAGKIKALSEGADANYPKIFGWALTKAKERNLYRP